MAENIVFGNPVNCDSEELKDFNNYFIDKNYDAFLVDDAMKNNSLTFTLLYIYHK